MRAVCASASARRSCSSGSAVAAGSKLGDAVLELLAQLGRLRQRALGRRALGPLGLGLGQRLARVAHRGLGRRAQRDGLLAGGLLLGAGGPRQGVEALHLGGRLLGPLLGIRAGGDRLLELSGDRLRLRAGDRQRGGGPFELLDLLAGGGEPLDRLGVRRAQLV